MKSWGCPFIWGFHFQMHICNFFDSQTCSKLSCQLSFTGNMVNIKPPWGKWFSTWRSSDLDFVGQNSLQLLDKLTNFGIILLPGKLAVLFQGCSTLTAKFSAFCCGDNHSCAARIRKFEDWVKSSCYWYQFIFYVIFCTFFRGGEVKETYMFSLLVMEGHQMIALVTDTPAVCTQFQWLEL